MTFIKHLLVLLSSVWVVQLVYAESAQQFETDLVKVKVQKEIENLQQPWAIAFLPNGDKLITQRGGDLLYIAKQQRWLVKGVPAVYAKGQGGLLDVIVSNQFNVDRKLFLTYAEPSKQGGRTKLISAELSEDRRELLNIKTLFQQKHFDRSTRHFGSRVVQASSGDLFVTIGDRATRESAQDLDVYNGKVVRVKTSGAVEIFSYGHRNPQGAAIDAKGELWIVEHGAKGGDEINKPEFGKNYGWPIISYGRHYSGFKIGEGTEKEGMEQPRLYWDPSIAPSGMMIYSGALFPQWQGHIFVGSLKFSMISRSVIEGGKVVEKERLFEDRFIRIRDIREAPDGSIWFLSIGDGAAYRILPADH